MAFSIVAQPEQDEDALLNPLLAVTDSSGLARTQLILGSKPGTYRISARIAEGFPDNEVIFTAKASRKNWVWILIISLFGGLGLFLFDMTAGAVEWTITSVSTSTSIVLPSGALGDTAGTPDGDGEAI